MESFFEGTSVEMYFARRRNRDIGICLCNIAEKLTVIKLRLFVTQNASATIETPWYSSLANDSQGNCEETDIMISPTND